MCALSGNNVPRVVCEQFERVTLLHAAGWCDVYRKSIIRRMCARAKHSFARFRIVCRGLRSTMCSLSRELSMMPLWETNPSYLEIEQPGSNFNGTCSQKINSTRDFLLVRKYFQVYFERSLRNEFEIVKSNAWRLYLRAVMKKTQHLRRSEIRSICLQRENGSSFGSIYKFLSAESNQSNIFFIRRETIAPERRCAVCVTSLRCVLSPSNDTPVILVIECTASKYVIHVSHCCIVSRSNRDFN